MESEAQVGKEEQKEPEVTQEQKDEQRTKELKSMPVDELKTLVKRLGGDDKQKKGALVEAIIAHETKVREDAQAQQEKIRTVVTGKKKELEGSSISDLAKMCESMNVVGARTKEEKVERLLKRWVDADGIAKALQQQREIERKQELLALDNSCLRKLCVKRGIDPFVHEVMAEKILWHESAKKAAMSKPKAESEKPKGDMIEQLLLREKEKQTEKEEAKDKEEELAAKKKEIKSMAVDKIKAALTKRDIKPEGSKEELVSMLLEAQVYDENVKARKVCLTKMNIAELKDLVLSKGLDAAKKRDELVADMLAYEADIVKQQRDLEGVRKEALVAKKQEFENMSGSELKDACSEHDLATSGAKDVLIGRLMEYANQTGEIDKLVTKMKQAQRHKELLALDKEQLVKMVDKAGLDPCVKEVMVDRLMMAGEAEGADTEADEPVKKRAKKH
eukprot:gnl/TRDRNA2_/TRDRNA2_177850_c1_seq4.p1 gnl/TRDRNA2_/TRDRNA2_177850_c1~~gnl/TRDRNA2_/TRDRNA2_177850_c1_seq4.p1  ORF type:complete len:454 (-),score=196.60 gnl/TRDRNA2_/TRDRNA2_177850_c1_seq4:217-1557(-)